MQIILTYTINQLPVLVAALWVRGRSPADIVGSNPTGGMDVYLLWVLGAVRVSATS
jgi:hypothetical protein